MSLTYVQGIENSWSSLSHSPAPSLVDILWTMVTDVKELEARLELTGDDMFTPEGPGDACPTSVPPPPPPSAAFAMNSITSSLRNERKMNSNVIADKQRIDRAISTRKFLVDWMFERLCDHEKFLYPDETMAYAVEYLDRVLASITFESTLEVRLACLVCIVMATKVHGSPHTQQLLLAEAIDLAEGTVDRKYLIAKELELVQVLQWRLQNPTSFVYSIPLWTLTSLSQDKKDSLAKSTNLLLRKCVQDIRVNDFHPSSVAMAAALFVSYKQSEREAAALATVMAQFNTKSDLLAALKWVMLIANASVNDTMAILQLLQSHSKQETAVVCSEIQYPLAIVPESHVRTTVLPSRRVRKRRHEDVMDLSLSKMARPQPSAA